MNVNITFVAICSTRIHEGSTENDKPGALFANMV